MSKINRVEFLHDPRGPLVRRSWAQAQVGAALGIDPATEVAAQRLAAAVGLAPPVLDFDPQRRTMLMPQVTGVRLETDWALRTERRAAMHDALSRLRSISAPTLPAIDLQLRARELYGRLVELDPVAAKRYEAAVRSHELAGEAPLLQSTAEPQPVLVHGDLTPENIIVRPDGSFCLIDWEYAHRGHADEDLAGLVTATAHPLVHDWAVEPACLPMRVGIRRLLDGLWIELAAVLQGS